MTPQGQGARLITDPSVLENVFYRTIPGKTGGALYWIVFVFGIMATVSPARLPSTSPHQLILPLFQLIASQGEFAS